MKIPEKAPDWMRVLTAKINTLFESQNIETLNELVAKIDQSNEYIYWDRFKYYPMPQNITTEEGWAYLKFSRQAKMRGTKLIDKSGSSFKYWFPDNVLKKLSFIDKYTGGQITTGDAVIHKSEQKRYLINSLMEEAIASSQLEGAATTRKIAKEMMRSGRKPSNHAEKMIYNNFQTILEIKDLINRPLSEGLILELHRSMTCDTLEDPSMCGRFRTNEDEPINVKDQDGSVLYEPPEPDKIAPMMKILYDYTNETSEEAFTHPAIKAINLHFYLSYIHPFNDGNGRTARALFYWYMLKNGYWMFEYLTISKIFIETPSRYAKAFLYTEIDDLDLTYFISFHIRTISIAIQRLLWYLKLKQREMKNTAHWLTKYTLNSRQKEAIRYIVEHPEELYTISIHQKIHGVTYETARGDLLYLTDKQIVTLTKRGRMFCFFASKTLGKKIKNH